ncbi:hypothetical protein, partial [Solidesulfovibrio sp.]|uniref:hypothetical protein n=1 Tax=Solidesulfovibrio sp. TaxID=2910990 RepID=UPI002B203FA8
VVRLMEEERTFKYSKFNMPVRVLFSQFLKFQESKINYPQIFCWPGYCFSNSKEDGVELSLFKNHGALFVDGEDGDVYPQLFEGRDALDVQETFNSFFEWNALFDLTRQWVVGDGDFVLDYSWLTSKHDNVVIDKWAKHLFSDLFRVSLDGFTVL